MVPNPNKNIYKLPCQVFPVAKAPNNDIYTKPQGKKPLRKPIVKNVSDVFFFNSFPNADFTFEINL